MTYKVLDLFCGAGGLSLGFKNAGFEIVGGVEFDEAAIKTHNYNFNKDGKALFEYQGDISQVTDDEIQNLKNKIDVIIGGPPCQGFSNGNRQQKLEDDPRNKLFLNILDLLELLNQKHS